MVGVCDTALVLSETYYQSGVFQLLLALIYLHVWYLPHFVPNILWIPPLMADGSLCGAAWHKSSYDNVVTFMNVLLPETLMYVSYPILLTLVYKRRREKQST